MQKAIVESIDGTKARVRMPELHKISGAVGATPSSEIPLAAICTVPGCRPNLRPGDVVLVDFENEDYGMPIIIGTLFTENGYSSIADLELGSLRVKANVKLPEDTSIGNVTYKNIMNIENTYEDIQQAIDNIRKSIDKISERIDRLESEAN